LPRSSDGRGYLTLLAIVETTLAMVTLLERYIPVNATTTPRTTKGGTGLHPFFDSTEGEDEM
jgi:hypothetical protein